MTEREDIRTPEFKKELDQRYLIAIAKIIPVLHALEIERRALLEEATHIKNTWNDLNRKYGLDKAMDQEASKFHNMYSNLVHVCVPERI